MKRLIILFFLFPALTFAQNWQWTVSDGSPDLDVGNAICADGFGNCYVASDSFLYGKISKYDISGNLIWRKETWKGYARAITIDAANNLYVYGDSAAFGFMAKYDNAGNRIWKIIAGTTKANGICADNSGNLYITGYHNIARYDTAGNPIWTRNLSNSIGNAVCTDNTGHCFVTGIFGSTETFGAFTLTAHGSYDIFTAEYDTAGTCIWANRAGGNVNGGPHDDFGNSIVADGAGNVFVTGHFADTADFGAFVFPSSPFSNNGFIVKYDQAGTAIWAQQIAGNSDQEGRSISIDNQGNILVGGSYVPSAIFGSYTLPGWGNYDAFIAKYDGAGNFLNVINAGGPAWNEYVFGITVDAAGNIFATGGFCDAAYFGNDTLTAGGNVDLFVSKIDLSIGTDVTESDVRSSITVFPNPASSIATFQISGVAADRTIFVFDQFGREVWRKQNDEDTVQLSTEGFMSGMYFYRIEENNEIKAAGKLIVE